ncbi:MAG TPA: transcriptional regulator NrdR [Azoarcus taiwanensis]|uniref:Transcriptional repressor NrdR n=1 Tax=Azoarcus taiwanensis TaxID=666964 RepID=A0A972F5J1_9RHOO|nr:transcriptional regulator NrdR [Azoarcus taiwanensis]NMG01437.1 transcriptional repressor NrdR [Azoarcus taiwanensis]HRQ58122.1 transcriptional regulator NrdR [Azoarcus taiwanensis]
MKCPFCGDPNTQVTDTRENEDGDVVRRRRRCVACDKRFTTYERIDLKMPHIVKRNGNRSEFDHAKLSGSMKLALRKRPVASEAVEAAIGRIEARLLSMGESEVASEKVGELVMRELKKLDKVAYIRFASVYRNFADVDEFSEVIREVQARPRRPRGSRKNEQAPEDDLFGS